MLNGVNKRLSRKRSNNFKVTFHCNISKYWKFLMKFKLPHSVFSSFATDLISQGVQELEPSGLMVLPSQGIQYVMLTG